MFASFNNNLHNRITIGAGEWASNQYNTFYDGNIDEVAIWNKSLSLQEIQQYMSCSPANGTTDLVSFSNLDLGLDPDVPAQSCGGGLTNANGCDSIAILNLSIAVCGCTDATALNYNINATLGDSSCIYCTNASSILNF